MGDIKLARKQGMVAAYLNIIAIFFALVVVVVAVNAAVWGYSYTYLLQECLAEGVSLPYRPLLAQFYNIFLSK